MTKETEEEESEKHVTYVCFLSLQCGQIMTNIKTKRKCVELLVCLCCAMRVIQDTKLVKP